MCNTMIFNFSKMSICYFCACNYVQIALGLCATQCFVQFLEIFFFVILVMAKQRKLLVTTTTTCLARPQPFWCKPFSNMCTPSVCIDVDEEHPIGCACALCFLHVGTTAPGPEVQLVACPEAQDVPASPPEMQLVARPEAQDVPAPRWFNPPAEPPRAPLLCRRQRSRCLGVTTLEPLGHNRNYWRQLQVAQQKLRRRDQMILRLRADQTKLSNELAITHVRSDKAKTITWDGATSCALRVTLGNVKAARACLVLMEHHLSRSTMLRYELQTSGGLKFAVRCFHNTFLRSFGDGSAEVCRGAICDQESLPNLLEDEIESSGVCLIVSVVLHQATNQDNI